MKQWIDIYIKEIAIVLEIIALLVFTIGLLVTAITLEAIGPIIMSIGFAMHTIISIIVSIYIFKR